MKLLEAMGNSFVWTVGITLAAVAGYCTYQLLTLSFSAEIAKNIIVSFMTVFFVLTIGFYIRNIDLY